MLEEKFKKWLIKNMKDLSDIPLATKLYKAYIEGYNQKIEDQKLDNLLKDLFDAGIIDSDGRFKQ